MKHIVRKHIYQNRNDAGRTTFLFMLSLLLTTTLLSCGGGPKDFDKLGLKPEEIKAPDSKMDLTVLYCPRQSQNVQQEIYFQMVIDTSNSNWAQLGQNGLVCYKGNDMENARFTAVKNFLTEKLDDPNINVTLSIVLFGNTSDPECSNFFAGNTSPFSNNRTEILELLDRLATDLGPSDSILEIPESCLGATNYKEALKRATDLRDLHTNNLKIKYPYNSNPDAPAANITNFVYFMSDGAPIVNGFLQSEIDIIKSVLAFRDSGASLNNSNIRGQTNIFSTIFYNKKPVELLPGADPSCQELYRGEPQKLLATMARIGGGAALIQSAPSLDDLYVDPSQIAFETKEVQLFNTNARWIIEPDSNKINFVADQDADSISDVEELLLGSNPLVADTNGNGMHDGHELNLFGKPLNNQLPACWQTLGHDTDLDGLTNCLESLYGTNPELSDTDGDGLTDGMAIFYNIPGSNYADNDADQDGSGNAQEAAFDALPPMFPNFLIENDLIPQTYSYTPIDDLAGFKGCSKVDVTYFRTYQGQEDLALKLNYYSTQNFGGTQQFTQSQVQLSIPNKYCLYDSTLPSSVCNGTGKIPFPFTGVTTYEYPKPATN
jgi:hypothetical protein